MKENNIPTIDPAEICECNQEWSNSPGCDDGDGCRCSIAETEEDRSNSSTD